MEHTKVRTIRIDEYTWNELDRISKAIGQTKSKFIIMATIEKMNKVEMGLLRNENTTRIEKGTIPTSN